MLKKPGFWPASDRNLFESADFSERKAAQQHKNRVSSRNLVRIGKISLQT